MPELKTFEDSNVVNPFAGVNVVDFPSRAASYQRKGSGDSKQIGNPGLEAALRQMLTSIYKNGSPSTAKFRQQGTASISNSADQAQSQALEGLIGRGMGRSGIGGAVEAKIEEGKENSLAKLETGLAGMDEQARMKAIQGLLGIEQLGLSKEGLRLQRLAIENQAEANEFDFFRDFLPGLLQFGAETGSAAIAASDSRFKENITQTGISESGLPIVQFNYKGDDRKYKGVIAQDVEKTNPDAVSHDKNGMKYVDYSKIDVQFEEV